MAFLDLDYRIEYDWVGPAGVSSVTPVLLHHGLGSVSAWRDFPRRVAEATGCSTLVYSRRGYGASAAAGAPPWPPDFMHRGAQHELPAVLQELDVQTPLLVGHSDGASIALLFAAARLAPRPSGLVLLAPHVFVQEETLAGARRAAVQYEAGPLRKRLARHHTDPDGAFYGWCRSWLAPEFRGWNIEAELSRVTCPVTVIQGDADEYGTLAQVDSIRQRCAGPVTAHVLAGAGHAPQDNDPELVLAVIRALAV